MAQPFEMRVDSLFHVPQHGTVLAGRVAAGHVRVGDRIAIASPAHAVSDNVAGIESVATKSLLTHASAGDDIAILVRHLDLQQLPDGWTRTPDGPIVSGHLTVRSMPPPWWKVW